MLLCLKNGGYAIFTGRFSYLGDYWYTDKLENMVKEGRMKKISEEEFFKYDKLPHCVGKFTKTPCKIFIYQKTEEDTVKATHRYLKKSSMTLSNMTADSY